MRVAHGKNVWKKNKKVSADPSQMHEIRRIVEKWSFLATRPGLKTKTLEYTELNSTTSPQDYLKRYNANDKETEGVFCSKVWTGSDVMAVQSGLECVKRMTL